MRVLMSKLLGTYLLLLASSQAVDFPPVVDADDIAYFFRNNDLEGLHWALSGVFNLSARVLGSEGPRPLLASQIARGGGAHYSAEYKLRLDLEQVRGWSFASSGGSRT